LKSFPFFLLIIFFLSSADSTEIATFKISYVINNSLEFDKFIDKLDTLRTKMQNDLLEDENELINKKNIIEESKVIFTESEYNQQIEDYNILANSFKEKLSDFNNHININIEKNKEIVINEIIEITKILSHNKNLDIILNEDQYFLASDDVDISKQIIEILNKKKLNLEVIELPIQ
jgi:Skp family chaperone for outer membrane proteins